LVMVKVAVLGLGMMGSGIAENLLNRGHEVHVYNRTSSKAEPLEARGAIVHKTPIDAVKAGVDIVVTMVTDQDAFREIAFESDGFLQGMSKGTAWIDMSTISPEASIEHAAECERRGIERLDAPVIGGPQLIAKGEVLVIVGGEEETYRKHSGFLHQIGREVMYMGPEGAGHKMKLAFNLYLAIMATGFSEAMTFAQKLGLTPEAFADVVNKTPHKNRYTETKGPRVIKNDFTPSFTLKMIRKDLALVQNEVTAHKMSLPTAGAVHALFTAGMNQGLSESDYSSIVLTIRKLNGI
jgi:3-hydroxyisobutyrate dehydrogenase